MGGKKKPTSPHPVFLSRLTYSQSRMRGRQTPNARAVPGNGSLFHHPSPSPLRACHTFPLTPIRATNHYPGGEPNIEALKYQAHLGHDIIPLGHGLRTKHCLALSSYVITAKLIERKVGKSGKWKIGKTKRKSPSTESRHAQFVTSYIPTVGNFSKYFTNSYANSRAPSSFHPVRDASSLHRTSPSLMTSQASNTFSLVVGWINGAIVRSLGVDFGPLAALTRPHPHLRRLLEIPDDSYDLHASGRLWYQTAA